MFLGNLLGKIFVECLESVMTEWKSKKHVKDMVNVEVVLAIMLYH